MKLNVLLRTRLAKSETKDLLRPMSDVIGISGIIAKDRVISLNIAATIFKNSGQTSDC